MTLIEIRRKNRPEGVRLPNLSNYIITEDGNVWSDIKNKILRNKPNNLGYIKVGLKNDEGKQKLISVHRLVALAFIPNPDNKPEVNHKDGNPANNHKDNLEWVTHKENIQHSFRELNRSSKVRKGENHPHFGKTFSDETRAKQSAKKMGELHPKFKGYYSIDGVLYSSLQQIADVMQTSTMQVSRMIKSNRIDNYKFIPRASS